ncbi:MAG: fmt [Planctomycetaceae bacterium]|nr:fmt [Planctomycetaceae bacterium]
MAGLKIVMLGTGEFAVPSFASLYDTRHQVLALYTQPDRIRAGKEVHANQMKDVAMQHGTPVFQPEKINTPEALEELAALGADLFLVAAYGQILSRKFLAIPRLGSFNIHASLLPKYRGAAPINYAILNGETETGVSLIEIVPALDAGPVVGILRTPIGETETAGELETRLATLAAPLTVNFLDQAEQGKIERIPQDPAGVTLAPKMTKEFGLIPWSKSAAEIGWHVRGLQPWPTAFTFLHQPSRPAKRLVIRQVAPTDRSAAPKDSIPPGTVVSVAKDKLWVQTGTDPISIVLIQPEGKKPMSVTEFLNGNRLVTGDRFA